MFVDVLLRLGYFVMVSCYMMEFLILVCFLGFLLVDACFCYLRLKISQVRLLQWRRERIYVGNRQKWLMLRNDSASYRQTLMDFDYSLHLFRLVDMY